MYSTKISSGNAEIIESNSVISFNPAPYGKNPIKNKTGIEHPQPIDIDCYYDQEFLFTLHFEFIDSDDNSGNPSWKSDPDKNNKTQNFYIKNLRLANGSINNSLAFDVASAADGSAFYVSFSVIDLDFSVKLDYTIYRVWSVLDESRSK